MRAYATQVEVLRRLRSGGQQFVRVEHVHVNDGRQAVIGNVKKQDGRSSAAAGMSNVRDFNEMVRIQTEFMQSFVNAMGEQTKELTETYAKTAADIAKKPFAGMSS